MNDNFQPGRDGSHGAAWLSAVIAVFVLYVLSPPLAVWLVDRAGVRPAPFVWIYAPITVVRDHCEPVKAFYTAYGKLFGLEM